MLVKSQSLFKIYENCACVYSKFPTGGIIWLLKVSVFYFWSCFYFSPELQALLMNQLTVKVNLSGRVHWIIHTTVTCFICCNSIFNHPGLEDVGSVHWFLLLQHSETCYQSPAEVRVIRKHLTRWIELIQFVFFFTHWAFFCSYSGSEALLYHLSEVKGMALWKQKFQPLGLDPAAIEGRYSCNSSLI